MEDPPPPPIQPVSSFVVVARIIAVSGMSIAVALAIFFFLGGLWQGGLPALDRGGLVGGRVLVRAFVVGWWQAVADYADRSKRRRGRRGLDILDVVRDVD